MHSHCRRDEGIDLIGTRAPRVSLAPIASALSLPTHTLLEKHEKKRSRLEGSHSLHEHHYGWGPVQALFMRALFIRGGESFWF